MVTTNQTSITLENTYLKKTRQVSFVFLSLDPWCS